MAELWTYVEGVEKPRDIVIATTSDDQRHATAAAEGKELRVPEEATGVVKETEDGSVVSVNNPPSNLELAEAQQELSEGEQRQETETSVARQRLADIEKSFPGATDLCTTAAQQLQPDALDLLDKSPFGADVLTELATNPGALERFVTGYTPQQQKAMLASRMWQLQQQAVAQKGRSPRPKLSRTPPVSGNVRVETKPGDMTYAEYRSWRDATSRGRIRK